MQLNWWIVQFSGTLAFESRSFGTWACAFRTPRSGCIGLVSRRRSLLLYTMQPLFLSGEGVYHCTYIQLQIRCSAQSCLCIGTGAWMFFLPPLGSSKKEFMVPKSMVLFRINRTSSTYLHDEGLISHCAAIIWICPMSHQSSQHFKWMQFKGNFYCTLWIRG